jgi:hypothetical protein
MDVRVNVPLVTTSQAVDGMRAPFLQAFGRGLIGQRLAAAAWCAFHAALTHGSGLHAATSHARVAAEERNDRTALVARWSTGRIQAVVQEAATRAANAG